MKGLKNEYRDHNSNFNYCNFWFISVVLFFLLCMGYIMKKDKINMYQVPIKKIYRVKQYWTDWLKYRLPIPKKITPYILSNLLGVYK